MFTPFESASTWIVEFLKKEMLSDKPWILQFMTLSVGAKEAFKKLLFRQQS